LGPPASPKQLRQTPSGDFSQSSQPGERRIAFALLLRKIRARLEQQKEEMKILQYSKWDAICVLCGFLHFAYVLTFFFVFPYAPWWVLVCMGLIYSVSVSWNINGVSHNLIHNPFFKSRILNRLFSIMESVTMGISQTFYKHVHHRHHMGNSDRPDEHGHTHDWISIYRHGHNGEAENPWSYIFLSYGKIRRPFMPRSKEKIRSMRDGASRKSWYWERQSPLAS
jgi:fatty acid desaturase